MFKTVKTSGSGSRCLTPFSPFIRTVLERRKGATFTSPQCEAKVWLPSSTRLRVCRRKKGNLDLGQTQAQEAVERCYKANSLHLYECCNMVNFCGSLSDIVVTPSFYA